jgi:hypothetical protein
VSTGVSDRHVARFPAVGAIVKPVNAQADAVLAFADGAVAIAFAVGFRFVALRAHDGALHFRLQAHFTGRDSLSQENGSAPANKNSWAGAAGALHPLDGQKRIICWIAAGGIPMAKTKQFTITVQNQPGTVAQIAKTLGTAKVNILALLATSQGTTGTVQLIAEDARRAKKALDAAGIAYQETPAEEVALPNKPGALAQCLDKLATKGVNLSSIHATASKGGRKAVVVYTAEAAAKTATA